MDADQLAREVLHKIALDLQVSQLALQGCLYDIDGSREERHRITEVMDELEECIVSLLDASESISEKFQVN